MIKNIAVFVSGNGSTLQAIIDSINNNVLDLNIKVVVSNNHNSYAIKRAQKANIDTFIIKDSSDENILFNLLKTKEIDLIILAGYLKLIDKKIINNFMIINTHPSLLPKYGGKGMYGMNVHEAVINNHEKESGATLHFVNEEYDKGKIISQTKVDVNETDTALDLARRVQKVEKIQLIKVLKDFSKGNIN